MSRYSNIKTTNSDMRGGVDVSSYDLRGSQEKEKTSSISSSLSNYLH